jgi:hypothetical protein
MDNNVINEVMTNAANYAEIEETLTKWNMTEKELLLVLWVTLKQHGHMDKAK